MSAPCCPRKARSAACDAKHRRAIGLCRHDADRHHRLLVEKLDAERADQLGERQCRLHQREMRPDANARPDAERQIGKTIRQRRPGTKRDGMNAFGSFQSFSCRCSNHGAIRTRSFFLTGRPAMVSAVAAERAIRNAGG